MRMIDLWAPQSFTTATTNKQFGRQQIGLNGVDVFYPAKGLFRTDWLYSLLHTQEDIGLVFGVLRQIWKSFKVHVCSVLCQFEWS